MLLVSVAVHDTVEPARVVYYLGTFDGTSFTPFPETSFRPLDYGKDFYAAQSWSGLPAASHQLIGWLGNWAYSHDLVGDRYNGCLSIPRALTLGHSEEGWEILQNPIDSITTLFQPPCAPDRNDESVYEWLRDDDAPFLLRSQTLDVLQGPVRIAIGDRDERWLIITLTRETDHLCVEIDRSQLWKSEDDQTTIIRIEVSRNRHGEPPELRLFIDTCCLELFLDGGRGVATELIPWRTGNRRVVITEESISKGGVSWELVPLKSVAVE